MKTTIKITLFEKLNKYQSSALRDRLEKVLQQEGYPNYKFDKEDNPVPSLDDVNNILHKHRSSMIGTKAFKRLQKDIISLYQNGVTTAKEQPKRYCTFYGKHSMMLYDW